MTKYFTLEGLEKFKKELDSLKNIKRKEVAERLKYTASFGDFRENFAYQQAKEDQAILEDKILELEELIRSAKVIEKKKIEKIQIGSIVTLISNNKEQKFQIVSPEEANPKEEKISFQSLLGKALLDKSLEEIVEIENLGEKTKYKILKIE